MKTKKTIKSLLTLASMTMLGTSATVAQQNLGAACGCPSTTSRTTQTIQSLAQANGVWTNLSAASYGGEITGNLTLTCDKIWTLDQKIYVASGATLTIEPGTLIKGTVASSLAAATALIIERGGKIMAPGTESCPIVFTAAADNLNGSYGVANKGMWGGVLLLGKASNNLKLATNGPFVPGQSGKLAVADGLGVIEGFASSFPQDQFGVALSVPVGTVLSTSPSGSYTFGLTAGAAASGSNASGQNKLTLSASAPAYVVQGQAVSGTGIAAGSTILSISGATLTLSANLTAAVTSGDAITFGGDYPNPGATGYFSSMTYVAPASGAAPTSGTSGSVASYVGAYYTSTGSFDDNDNSGVMTYVSIRHSGANLLVGSEINGLTLASVGRGTKIENIEIVSCADDNIEIFGGTVNLKYCTTLFGNDDMFDYDLGWTGKAQFFYGMKADQGGTGNVSVDNDNGIEADSDDNSNNATPKSHPILYNFTLMGNSKTAGTGDNRSLSGANFKEGAEGELYNSIIAGFKNGINLQKTIASGRTFEAYQNWTTEVAQQDVDANTESLKIKCNTLIGNTNSLVTNGSSLAANGTAANATETTQFGTTDKNDVLTSLTGFSSAFAINGTTNANITKNDPVPTTPLSITGCPTPPSDGFFEPAPYRGAFSSTLGQNWLSDWSYSQVLGQTLGIKACPTDLDKDGDTDVNDFTIFAPAFGLSCD